MSANLSATRRNGQESGYSGAFCGQARGRAITVTFMIESMGVADQVTTLDRIAGALVTNVRRYREGAPREEVLEMTAESENVPYSQMRYVLAFALNEGLVKQDRTREILIAG